MRTALALVQGMRPKQWIKNLFLFAGLVFTGNAANRPLLTLALAGFGVFCALCSGLYLLNDVRDRSEDRLHPEKRRRPVASGRLSPKVAAGAGLVLVAAAMTASATLGRPFFLAALAYLGLTTAYTAGLKHVVLLDLFILAGNFVIRAAAGALVIGVKVSPWLLICTTLIALFLGLGKRRHELVLLAGGAGRHRRTLDDYTLPFIDQMISVVTAATLMAYTLYAFSSETAAKHQGLLVTTPFVMYGLFRYLYLIYVKEEGGSPETTILSDPASILNFVLWTVAVLAVFHWGL